MKFSSYFWILFFLFKSISGFDLNPDDRDSVYNGIDTVTKGMLNYYNPSSHTFTAYWWMTGSSLNGMLNTYSGTKNSTNMKLITDALLANKGENNDFAPNSEKFDLGNDDQGIWGLTGMSAAEINFNDNETETSWAALAQAVLNEMSSRWDNSTCNGGIRWQIYTFNQGYDYKNTISNGALFQLAARLARYTHNDTYVDLARKVWDWSVGVGFVDLDSYAVYDGSNTASNCSTVTNEQWSYTTGVYLAGTAFLYNYTNGTSEWKDHLDGLLNRSLTHFFNEDKIIYEPSCETSNSCNYDQTAFKGMLARYLSYTMQLAPYTSETIMSYLHASAKAAAKACSGGYDAVTCGNRWTWNNGTWDNNYGLGEQLSALEVIQSVLTPQYTTLLSLDTGARSKSNPSAGQDTQVNYSVPAATKSDKGWAGFLTAFFSLIFLLFSIWLFF
ncbi:mannan endo-1,6-alpha-mannosidase [Schizosaccharomyces cryophilus OY26]|uniref:Mannan endo-1,6-alpha-mannosidase n=1 Tax=Schizosaccharomyces cryophilus (strain OY26 / ATCC MYA-4695 / CBS 11777 / NBRC 106824 / NRRL Y48691) TaxID=653667 RepID=S9WXY1_SCHCR|nr:mannan endo-1,6-alpha-mannosidase [Schizosaccharomyces cryophilus OY26]EPY49582.1 mannan endo-1,6-alpha-mannosidase [Schizosaccharomyces cryophilus OY26]